MSFGSRLRQRREQLGLTQQQLAEALGITRAAVGNYEQEVSSPKADILYDVFDALKCDANFLFQDEMKSFNSGIEPKDSAIQPVHPLLTIYENLNKEGQEKLMSYANDLAEMPKYKKRSELSEADRVG